MGREIAWAESAIRARRVADEVRRSVGLQAPKPPPPRPTKQPPKMPGAGGGAKGLRNVNDMVLTEQLLREDDDALEDDEDEDADDDDGDEAVDDMEDDGGDDGGD